MHYKFQLSQNDWESSSQLIIEAKEIGWEWDTAENESKSQKYGAALEESGNIIIADGVRLYFDEAFIYQGTIER